MVEIGGEEAEVGGCDQRELDNKFRFVLVQETSGWPSLLRMASPAM